MSSLFDELFIYKAISFLLTLSVVFWGIKKLGPGRQKVIFTLMLTSFFLSTILFFPEGSINDWLKHIPFFLGQLLFYFWLESLFSGHSPSQSPSTSLAQAAAIPPAGGFSDWFNFLTDQGLQHIIALPFLILIVVSVSVRFNYIPAELKSTLNLLLLAAGSLTLIHIGEFAVESQGWLPFLEQWIEQIEFFWYYLALVLFAIGVKRLAKTTP